LKGCCGLFGGMCPGGVRVYPNWRGGMCGESDHGQILVGDPLRRLTDTLTKFLMCGEGRLFVSVGKAGGVRFLSAIRVAGGCGVEACPWLERGLVRVRVRVTLDDGGHRHSQREQLMSDHSHAQLTVPDNLHDREPTNQIRSRATATYDLHHPTDEHVTTSLLPFATDRASQHTQLQPVARHRGRGVWC
jgi:hypothetical protein